MDINLTKREYLGDQYNHVFLNDKTGEKVMVGCTKEEYDGLNVIKPVNPTLEGHTWQGSFGSIKVNSPSTFLGKNEYCDYNGEYLVFADRGDGVSVAKQVAKDLVVDDTVATEAITYGDSI